jgi:hypothetical protein
LAAEDLLQKNENLLRKNRILSPENDNMLLKKGRWDDVRAEVHPGLSGVLRIFPAVPDRNIGLWFTDVAG